MGLRLDMLYSTKHKAASVKAIIIRMHIRAATIYCMSLCHDISQVHIDIFKQFALTQNVENLSNIPASERTHYS